MDKVDLTAVVDEEGVTNVKVEDYHLIRFPALMNYVEEHQWGLEDGVLKLNICPVKRRPLTSLPHLLEVCKEGLRKCYHQLFLRSPWDNMVYGYKAVLCDDKTTECFIEKMQTSSSYTDLETCCTKILQSKGVKGVAEHYFNEISKNSSLLISKRAAGLHQSLDQEANILLEKGRLRRAEFEEVLTSLTTPSHAVRNQAHLLRVKKPLFSSCACTDCLSGESSDSEVEENGECNGRNTLDTLEKNLIQVNSLKNLSVYCGGFQLDVNTVRITPNFGLGSLYSVLDVLDHYYRKLQQPCFYIGDTHSTSVAHIENASLLSANFLHYGKPKLWVTISGTHFSELESLLKKVKLNLAHTSCENLLSHEYFLPTLKLLDTHNIPYKCVTQTVGDLLILYPNTVHFGFSLGPNISEAVNFGTVSWIPKALQSKRCRCYGDSQIHPDLKLLVATFHPEMIKLTLQTTPTVCDPNSQHVQKVDVEHEPEDGKPLKRTVKLFQCPYKKCEKVYQDHRNRLLKHVQSAHPEDSFSLMKILRDKYPVATPKMKMKNLCPVCKEWKSGSMTHLENHLRRQLHNKNLQKSVRENYKNAYDKIQQDMKTKRRHPC